MILLQFEVIRLILAHRKVLLIQLVFDRVIRNLDLVVLCAELRLRLTHLLHLRLGSVGILLEGAPGVASALHLFLQLLDLPLTLHRFLFVLHQHV